MMSLHEPEMNMLPLEMTVAKSRNQVGGRSTEQIFKSQDLTNVSDVGECAKVVLNFGKIGLFTAPETIHSYYPENHPWDGCIFTYIFCPHKNDPFM